MAAVKSQGFVDKGDIPQSACIVGGVRAKVARNIRRMIDDRRRKAYSLRWTVAVCRICAFQCVLEALGYRLVGDCFGDCCQKEGKLRLSCCSGNDGPDQLCDSFRGKKCLSSF